MHCCEFFFSESHFLWPLLREPRRLEPQLTPSSRNSPPVLQIPREKVHATKVVFADLKGPEDQTHAVGRWLSDQLGDSCNKDFAGLEIIIRPQHEESAEGLDEAGHQKQEFKSVEEWARSVGANVFVMGLSQGQQAE